MKKSRDTGSVHPGQTRMFKPKPIAALFLLGTVSLTAMAGDAAQAFNIPAQALDSALTELAYQTNLRLLYPADLVGKLRSSPVSGQYTPEQAMQRMLQDSGLTVRKTADDTFTVEPAANAEPRTATTMPAVTVVGKAVYDSTDPYNQDYNLTHTKTATKTDTPIMETPFSVQVVSKQVIEDQQVIRLKDALKNISGVVQGGDATGSDHFNIRGFDSTMVYRDGSPFPIAAGIPTNRRETANVENIDVLKGPASLLYGRTEPGGIVNVTTKQPLSHAYYSLQQQFGSYDLYRTTVDATGPITSDNSLLYRFNLAYQDNNSFRDYVGNERVFVAPVLTWNIDARTKATFELEYLHDESINDPGVPGLGNRPAPAPRKSFLSEPNAKITTDKVLVGLNWSHQFNDNWEISQRFNAEFTQYDQIGSFFFGQASASGNVDRGFFKTESPWEKYYTNVNLTGKFNTGVVKHKLLMGGDYFREDLNVKEGCCPSPSTPINVFNPVPTGLPNFDVAPVVKTSSDWFGLYLQDQMELPHNFFALGGMRYDNARGNDELNGGAVTIDEDRVSPRGGLLWRPIPELSVYGSYTENFGANNGVNRNGQLLKPETAQQWETGIKTELWDGRFSASLAYFELTKQNIRVTDPTNFTLSKSIGEAMSQGIEMDAKGEVMPGWNIIGSYAHIPVANITKDFDSSGGIGNQGNRLYNSARNSGSLWNVYEFQDGDMQGLKFGAGAVVVGKRQADNENLVQMPGYVTLNLMTSYQQRIGNSKFTVQFNVDNLLDKSYFASANGFNQHFFGTPRTFLGSVRLEY
ncbi:TonB-dependent receptor [Methylomonas sp. LW13]|uniref:TonB-dependent siderophore receptor n=1 Tax=unclassified Methylomonas TaxID=2608980 RepID=UPI0006905131|nr:TonB-dependent receptor [Methylomonas sp. LW13]QBC26860.1 TonB-dependent receptor [Methylomonas sp. LW13]